MQYRILILSLIFSGVCLSVSAETASSYFSVKKGDSVFQVARGLKDAGYIRSRFAFIVPLLWSGEYKKLKAGRYSMTSGMSNRDIAGLFEKGTTAPVRIDIIPGITINDISRLLSKADLPQAEEFLRLSLPGSEQAFKQPFLAGRPAGAGLEGYLYPDSYLIDSTESADEIMSRLLDNFAAHFSQSTSTERILKNRSLYEIVTMASILEKEVRTVEDKKKVSGILWKRIEYGLPLQVDSTGSYFLAKRPAQNIVKPEDMSYDTYEHVGLPFGPISNPSAESLSAASQPTPSDYWYYLSSRDGTIIYSKTLGEHLINKAKFVE